MDMLRETHADGHDAASVRHPLDEATQMTWTGDGFDAHVSRLYWNFTGPFGGVTAAMMMRAILQHPARRGLPVAMTVNYCAPASAGPCRILLREARTNRSTQHWWAEMIGPDGGAPWATATAVFGARPETWRHQPAEPPAPPPADQLVRFPWEQSPCAWMGRYDMRMDWVAPIGAHPLAEPLPGRQLTIMRDEPPRPLDYVSLSAFADAFFARIFVARGAIMPVGTISMSTWFHATEADLARQGEQPLIASADTRVYNNGFHDQSAELWSADGQLLATSHQVVYFRDPPEP